MSGTTVITPREDFDRNLTLEKATITSYKINSARTPVHQISTKSLTLFLLVTLLKILYVTPAQFCLLKKIYLISTFLKNGLLTIADNSLWHNTTTLIISLAIYTARS